MLTKSIIIFKDSATDAEVEAHIERVKAQGGHVTNVYKDIYKGFAAVLSDTQLNELQHLVGGDNLIDYIESDGVVTIF